MEEQLSLAELIRQLEERLLQADVRQSVTDVAALLADDFIEFGSSGRIYDKLTTIAALQHESPTKFTLTDYQAKMLSPNVILVTYRAVRSDSTSSAQSLRSSIWQQIDGHWQLVFHQGTPTRANSEAI